MKTPTAAELATAIERALTGSPAQLNMLWPLIKQHGLEIVCTNEVEYDTEGGIGGVNVRAFATQALADKDSNFASSDVTLRFE